MHRCMGLDFIAIHVYNNDSTGLHMARIVHLVLVIVLTYVCVLNVMIVHVMYSRYVKHNITAMRNNLQRPWTQNHTATTLRRRHAVSPIEITAPSCDQRRREIVVVTSPLLGVNDPFLHAPALPQLRHALRVVDNEQATHVFLLATTESFLSSHRAWCSALYMQTLQRVSCDLILLNVPPTPSNILRQVSDEAPCFKDVVLLPDTVHLTPNFLMRLERTSKTKVTCLVETKYSNTPRPLCAVQAFRLPHLFIEHYLNMQTQQPGHIPLENAARELHLYAGNAAVVGLG